MRHGQGGGAHLVRLRVRRQRRRVRRAADVRGGGVSVRVRQRRREVGVPPERLVLERRHMRVHVRQPRQLPHLFERLPVRRTPLLQLRQHKVPVTDGAAWHAKLINMRQRIVIFSFQFTSL